MFFLLFWCRFLMGSSESESEDERRVVRSAKTKATEDLLAICNDIRVCLRMDALILLFFLQILDGCLNYCFSISLNYDIHGLHSICICLKFFFTDYFAEQNEYQWLGIHPNSVGQSQQADWEDGKGWCYPRHTQSLYQDFGGVGGFLEQNVSWYVHYLLK